ncbi:MAG: AAA family ATPase, partial [Acidimicrobiales bacterium]|nr:AAA family ATPase [Acidimicrobiales bacterium]
MHAKDFSAPAAQLLEPEQMADMAMAHHATPTGFEPLDHVLDGGFLPEELVVVGGRPGVGKTISLIQWARHQAQQGQHVLLAHYEHSPLTVLVQLMLIEIGEFVTDVEVSSKARHDLADLVGGRRSWPDVVGSNVTVAEAHDRTARHAERLH